MFLCWSYEFNLFAMQVVQFTLPSNVFFSDSKSAIQSTSIRKFDDIRKYLSLISLFLLNSPHFELNMVKQLARWTPDRAVRVCLSSIPRSIDWVTCDGLASHPGE